MPTVDVDLVNVKVVVVVSVMLSLLLEP